MDEELALASTIALGGFSDITIADNGLIIDQSQRYILIHESEMATNRDIWPVRGIQWLSM
jgi:hypothetical protein